MALASFMTLTPTIVCLCLVNTNTLAHQILLVVLLFVVGMCIDIADVALMVEVDDVVTTLGERGSSGFSEKGALAQSFSLHNMAYSTGIFIGPSLSGLAELWGGWVTMVFILAIFAMCTSLLMWKASVSGLMNDDKPSEENDILLNNLNEI